MISAIQNQKSPIGNRQQLPLPLRVPAPRLPLLAIETAKDLLDLHEDDLFQLIDRGALWAFNIGSESAERPEIRILAQSLAHLGKERARDLIEEPTVECTRYPVTIEQSVALILAGFKHDKPFLTAKEISRVCNCGRTHRVDLVREGALPQMPGTKFRRGPGGSALISRLAFAAFLEARAL